MILRVQTGNGTFMDVEANTAPRKGDLISVDTNGPYEVASVHWRYSTKSYQPVLEVRTYALGGKTIPPPPPSSAVPESYPGTSIVG